MPAILLLIYQFLVILICAFCFAVYVQCKTRKINLLLPNQYKKY